MNTEEIKVTMGMDVGPLALGLRKGEQLLKAFEGSFAGNIAGKIFEHVLPMASVAGAMVVLEKAISKARDIRRESEEFGVSTSFIQDINNIGMLSGLSEQKIEKMMGAFLKTLPVGADVEEEFYRVADTVASVQDPVTKAAVAFEAFGKSGYKMLPILEKGAAGIKELGDQFSKFSDSNIKDLENAELHIKKFENVVTMFFGRVVEGAYVAKSALQKGAWWKYLMPETAGAAFFEGLRQERKDFTAVEGQRKQEEADQKAAQAIAKSLDERKKLDEAQDKFFKKQQEMRFKQAAPDGQIKMLQDEQKFLQHKYEMETSEVKRLEIATKILEAEEKIKEIQKKAAEEASKEIEKRFDKIDQASSAWLRDKGNLAKNQHPEFTLEELAQQGMWTTQRNSFGMVTGRWFNRTAGGEQANRIEQLREWAKQNAMSDDPGRQKLGQEQWSQADKLFDNLTKKFPFLKDPQAELKEHAKKSEQHLDALLGLAKGDGMNVNPAMGD